jgi:hypothetical protein
LRISKQEEPEAADLRFNWWLILPRMVVKKWMNPSCTAAEFLKHNPRDQHHNRVGRR